MPLAAAEHALTRDFAEEVYALLVTADLARWQADARAKVEASLRELQQKAGELRDGWVLPVLPDSPEATLRAAVAQVLERLPDAGALSNATVEEWDLFQRHVAEQLSPLYEAMATRLKECGTKARHLRPDNHLRAFFHAGAGLAAAVAYQWLFNDTLAWIAAGIWLAFSWSLEISRRFSDRWNDTLMRAFRGIAREHERYRVNSATWFGTALAILLLTAPGFPALLGLIAVSVGDPAAAIIGRRFGKTRLRSGRSLEGTLAFIGVSTAVALPWALLLRPELTAGAAVLATGVGVTVGALAELFADRVDDNLAIPVTSAWSAALALALLT